MLEKHVFLIVLRRRLVAAEGARRYRLRYRGHRARGDSNKIKGVTSPGVIFFLKRAILAHPFQSHFIGAREKGSKTMCF